jgi:hypothetical protein
MPSQWQSSRTGADAWAAPAALSLDSCRAFGIEIGPLMKVTCTSAPAAAYFWVAALISIPAFRPRPLAYAPSRIRARCLAQQKVLQNETVFATRERRATDPASYLLVDGLRPGVDFDQLVERSAVRAREGNERRRPTSSHDSPPNTQFLDY